MTTLSAMQRGQWSLARRWRAPPPVASSLTIDGLPWVDTGDGYATCSVVGRKFAVTTRGCGYRMISEFRGDHIFIFAEGALSDAEVSAAVYDELMLDRSEQ